MAGYAIGNIYNGDTARTMAYLILSVSQLIYVLEMRNHAGIFCEGITKFMAISLFASLALVGIVAFVPVFQNIFGLTLMPVWMYFVAIALSCLPTVVHEIWRLATRYSQKNQRKQL